MVLVSVDITAFIGIFSIFAIDWSPAILKSMAKKSLVSGGD